MPVPLPHRPARRRSAARPAPHRGGPPAAARGPRATRPSTGSPRWPPGCSAPTTPRSRCSPTRTPSSAATACPRASIGGPALLTGALSAIVVRTARPLNLPEAAADERVADLPAVTVRPGRAPTSASPLIAASGHPVGALAVYDPVPRAWSDDDAELLLQLAASVVAELELSAAHSAVGTSLARLEVALEASSIGIWEPDLRTGNGVLGRALRGAVRPRRRHRDRRSSDAGRPHPPRRPRVGPAVDGDGRSTDRGQFTVRVPGIRRDGSVRWMVTQGRVVSNSRGEPVRRLRHDPRRHRGPPAGRAAAGGRSTGRRRSPRSPRSWPTRPGIEDLAEIVLRGAAGARRAVQRPGHLRRRGRSAAAAHDPAAGRRDPGARRLPRRGRRDRARRRAADQYAAMHGATGAAGDREEILARFPATRGGHRAPGRHARSRPSRCGWRGGSSGAFVASGTPSTPSSPTTSRCWRRWPRRSR